MNSGNEFFGTTFNAMLPPAYPADFEAVLGTLFRLLSSDESFVDCLGWLGIYDREAIKIACALQLPLEAGAQEADACAPHKVYLNALGRVHVRPHTDLEVQYAFGSTSLFGYINMPVEAAATLRARVAVERHHEEDARRLFNYDLERAEALGALATIATSAIDALQHVEGVAVYVDDKLISVAEQITNAVATRRGAGLFDGLADRPLAAWSETERLFVAAAHSLFLSGKAVRFEEFNGTTMSARGVLNLLKRLARTYAESSGIVVDLPSSPFALGRLVWNLSLQLPAERVLRYRRTNGVSFRKTESLVAYEPLADIPGDLKTTVRELANRWCGSNTAKSVTGEAFHELVQCAVAHHDPSLVECLIAKLVESCLQAVNADYAMSSSLRNPGSLFADTALESQAGVLALEVKDFFCCICASREFAALMGENLRAHVFRPVQARMQFNRWHFIAGNLPRLAVPQSRHYFFPPLTPDIAEMSDRFHAAHIRAAVKYAIRAPGPDLMCPPLVIGGLPFRAFYDCRVVRTNGHRFELRDLFAVRCHTLFLGRLWQSVIHQCQISPQYRESFSIRAFAAGEGAVVDKVTGQFAMGGPLEFVD